MSKSVVLDFDYSIALAKKYWEALHDATIDIWPKFGLTSATESVTKKLGNSLVYYKGMDSEDNSTVEVSRILFSLESNFSENFIYQSEAIKKISGHGFELPSNASVSSDLVDVDLILSSIKLINEAWPAAAAEIQEYLSGIVVIDENEIYSLSGPTWFGAIFLGKPLLLGGSVTEVATSIVHEVGHLALFAECASASPLTELKEQHYSPFVMRERPALMVLHAQMAMARMVIWLHHVDSYLKHEENFRRFEGRFSPELLKKATQSYSECFLEAMRSVRDLDFTESGRRILEDFELIEGLLLKSKQ